VVIKLFFVSERSIRITQLGTKVPLCNIVPYSLNFLFYGLMNKVDVTSKARDLSSMEPLEESKNLCENVQRFFELQTKLKEEQKK